MCQDDISLDHLEAQLGLESIDIRNPRPQDKADALEALTQPENVGDTHIKLLLKYPDMYSIDPDLVKNFLKAYYSLLWNKEDPASSSLNLVMLVGQHDESAFVEIRSNEACTEAQIAPLIDPQGDNISVYVNHLDAAQIKRLQLANFFTNYIAHHQQGVNAELMFNRMNHHALAYLEVTGSFLAKNLPFYSVNLI